MLPSGATVLLWLHHAVACVVGIAVACVVGIKKFAVLQWNPISCGVAFVCLYSKSDSGN
jgi:hypothetical protein